MHMMILQPKHRSPRRLCQRMLCTALACAAPALHASTFTWFGLGNSDNWQDNTGNWNSTSPDPYPGYLSLHDNVVLPAASQGYLILLSSPTTIDGITVSAAYTLNITGSLALQQPVSGSGLTVNLQGGSLYFVSGSNAGST